MARRHPGTDLYQPTGPEFAARRQAVYREMRDEHPVLQTGDHTFVLSRFDDVWSAVHDHETFSSDHVAEAAGQAPMMIFMDPPRHDQLRALVSKAFTPRRIAELEPRLRDLARSLLADVGPGFDIVSQFASPLPSTIIAELIGVPAELRDTFRSWSEAFLDISEIDEVIDRFTRIYQLFDTLLVERRRSPQTDLMSALIAADIDGERLTDDELRGFCFLLLLAGNDTTSSLIANGAVLLAEHPTARAALVADPSLVAGAVEEMVRLEPPAQALPRTAMRDVSLHGVRIPEGSRVLLCWGAANLDEREFPDPTRFDIHRAARRHLGFGHGIHHCIGAPLARLEARVAFEELLRRAPDYELSPGRERHVSTWALAWRRVPVARV